MSIKWTSVARGIRYREHPTRKHAKRPDKYYTLVYKLNGKTISEGVGWASDGVKQEECENIMLTLRNNHRTGTGPQTLKETRESTIQAIQNEKKQELHEISLTLQGIFDGGYSASQISKTKSSLAAEARLMKIHITPFFGDTPLREITTQMMDRFLKEITTKISSRTNKPLSAATVRYTLAVIRQVWNYALSRDLTDKPYPAKRVKAPIVDNRRTRFLTREEADSLLNALKQRSQDLHDQALLSLYCGLRAGEIFKLEWKEVNFNEGFIHIRDRKNKESGIAWMTSSVREMLESRQTNNNSNNPLVFPSKLGKERDDTSKVFPKVVAELGLNDGITDHRDKIVFHSLRHTFASWLAQKGVPLHTLAGLMGHKTTIMTQRYAHLSPDGMKAAAMLIDNQ